MYNCNWIYYFTWKYLCLPQPQRRKERPYYAFVCLSNTILLYRTYISLFSLCCCVPLSFISFHQSPLFHSILLPNQTTLYPLHILLLLLVIIIVVNIVILILYIHLYIYYKNTTFWWWGGGWCNGTPSPKLQFSSPSSK